MLTAASIKSSGSTVLIRVKLISTRHVIVEHKVKGGNEEMLGNVRGWWNRDLGRQSYAPYQLPL